jgi:hypothetical protein
MEELMISLIAFCGSLVLILFKARKLFSLVTFPMKLEVTNLLAKVNETPNKQIMKNKNASGNLTALLSYYR